MKITVVSDLHLEFVDLTLENTQLADTIVLSGDIMLSKAIAKYLKIKNAENKTTVKATEWLNKNEMHIYNLGFRFYEFLSRCSNKFENVIYLAGNHEFYNDNWYSTLDTLRAACAEFKNVTFIEESHVNIGMLTFVGGTLWTNLNKRDPITVGYIKTRINDFMLIRNERKEYAKLHPYDTVDRHDSTLAYIKIIVEGDPSRKYIVTGHHGPTPKSVHPRYTDWQLNGGYSSDLSEFILDHPQIVLWTHGHTHVPHDYMMGTTRVVCNPRGYANKENTGWDPNMVVEV